METLARTDPTQRPDPAAWLEAHGDALFSYALLRVGERAVAEDLVQDTLLAALRAADRFSGAATERTWLTGILRHKVLDHLRQRARTPQAVALPDGAEPSAEAFDERGAWQTDVAAWASPERSLERDEFWRSLADCLDRLPSKLRTLFVLREFDGLETDQLLETLGLGTRNNAWVMLSRSRMRLRRCLQDSGFGWE